MYASSCAFTVVECIRRSKRCTFFTSLVFFAEAEERGCIFFSLSVCFPWINTVEGNLPWNIPLAQLKVTVMLRLKPRFREIIVLRNHVSKTTYWKNLNFGRKHSLKPSLPFGNWTLVIFKMYVEVDIRVF